MLSTKMRSTSRIVAKRARHSGNRREIKVPEVIIYYNKNMGDVDLTRDCPAPKTKKLGKPGTYDKQNRLDGKHL
ncbi:hypothetical protein M0802_013130 [Mischocyttarus mexicanus]|nr:hypothetical protein M0802_013130 [Mischocyttarus mexicanus]